MNIMRSWPGFANSAGIILVLASNLTACDIRTTEPELSRFIDISVITTGGDPDMLYRLSVTSQPSRDISAGGRMLFMVSRGVFTVEISDVAPNCALEGAAQRTVNLRGETSAAVVFEIHCEATGLEIRPVVEGIDLPAWLNVSVGGSAVHADLNKSAFITKLTPGSYTVEVSAPGNNCVAKSGATIVQVTNRVVTPVEIAVICTEAARPERIAYTASRTGFTVVEMIKPDGSDPQEIVRGFNPSWSPDGKRLAYSDVSCDYYSYFCTGGLNLVDPETRVSSVLKGGELSSSGSWGPDGGRIAFFTAASKEREIFLLSLGGDRTKITIPQVRQAYDADWSPTGEWIAFVCLSENASYTRICIIRTDGSGFAALTPETDYSFSPAWSPDGQRIVFSRSAAPNYVVAVVSLSGGEVATLGPGFDPAWSPDGSRIVFARSDGLFTMKPDGSDATRLTTGLHRSPTWRR